MKTLLWNLKEIMADHYGKFALLIGGSYIAYLLLNAVSFAHKVS